MISTCCLSAWQLTSRFCDAPDSARNGSLPSASVEHETAVKTVFTSTCI
jgi:hypothetical protein